MTLTGPALTIADDFAQLVAHVLAHVPLAQAGNLHDPRYVGWAQTRVAPDDRALLEHDARVLARCWAADPRLDLVHGFCALHRGLDEFAPTRARPLAQLEAREVRAPALLEALAKLPAAELLHATLALLADGYAELLADARAPLERAREAVAPWLGRLAAAIPSFGSRRVELVWALGIHGRAFDERLLVGAPAPWNGCSPARQAVLAGHEHLVVGARTRDYVGCEWSALTGLARALRDCEDAELAETHARWVGQLSLDELLGALVSRGRIGPGDAELLASDLDARPRRLAELFTGSP